MKLHLQKYLQNRPITARAQAAPKPISRTPSRPSKPLMSEEGVLRSLERLFPGSEWIEEHEATINGEPMTLQTVVQGKGPGPKNVLANDGVVYPYRKFKALKGRPLGASTSSDQEPDEAVSDTLPSGGPGATPLIAFIGGGKYEPKALVDWAKSQVDRGIPILVGLGRFSPKAQTAMDADARLIELGNTLGLPVFPVFPKLSLYGEKAKDLVTLEVLQDATEVVICGTGGKPNVARKWHSNPDFKRYREDVIPLIEI